MSFYLHLLTLLFTFNVSAQIIHHGHSHNDYLQKRPLFEALKHGYKSIEVDVWLHENRLVVSHTKFGLSNKKSIDSLYLKPLADFIKKSKGKLYDTDSAALVLMIDFKNNGAATYDMLKRAIHPHRNLFMQWQGDSLVHKAPLSLLISGAVPRNEIMADTLLRFVNIDGRMQDTAAAVSTVLVPRISFPWNKYFSWNGAGKMPKEELKTLRKLVEVVHGSGKTIRFWGAPDNFGVWRTLLNEGVDWVNTDNLKPFADYYRGRGQ